MRQLGDSRGTGTVGPPSRAPLVRPPFMMELASRVPLFLEGSCKPRPMRPGPGLAHMFSTALQAPDRSDLWDGQSISNWPTGCVGPTVREGIRGSRLTSCSTQEFFLGGHGATSRRDGVQCERSKSSVLLTCLCCFGTSVPLSPAEERCPHDLGLV